MNKSVICPSCQGAACVMDQGGTYGGSTVKLVCPNCGTDGRKKDAAQHYLRSLPEINAEAADTAADAEAVSSPVFDKVVDPAPKNPDDDDYWHYHKKLGRALFGGVRDE